LNHPSSILTSRSGLAPGRASGAVMAFVHTMEGASEVP
jgi:hypothetical protein